jgi:hypothetical protein
MIASELSNLKHGGDRKSDQDATLQLENMSRSDASELLNVSKRSVDEAAAINKVSPDLANEIKSGSKTFGPGMQGGQEDQEKVIAAESSGPGREPLLLLGSQK